MSHRVLVLEGITERGLQVLKGAGFEVDQSKAQPPAELAKTVGDYDAITIRSGSQITAEVFAAAGRLRVIGRPGIGVDNVDLEAATRHGVIVMNSPGGNMVSTAELALGLLFSVARPIPAADAAMKAGRWDRKSFAGVELHGKRLGIVGLGRIGREVAARCRALGMDVAAHDPFVAPALAESLHVRLLGLDELLAGSDFLTLHSVLTRESRHLLGQDAFARMKPGIRIVNAARGELIDEETLLAALDSGRVAAAAVDVHAQEPPADWRLARHPRVVATPHIGAQTAEAQERVGTDIAVQVRDFLKGGLIQNAVNFYQLGGDDYDQVRPAMELAERLGSFVVQARPGALERIELGLYGELSEIDAKPILSAATLGVLRPVVEGTLTIVNARAIARDKGIEVVETTSSSRLAFANLMTLRLRTSEGEFSVAGTVFGPSHLRLVDVDGVEVDAIPQGHLLLVRNDDTPGVVGQLGTLLGARRVNIARMTVGRRAGSGRAVMLIEVDSGVSPEVVAEVARVPGVREVRAVRLG